MTRNERFIPNGIPRYIHIYDNGGKTCDRYTIVFTRTGRTGSNRNKKQDNGHIYLGMSEHPTSPNGFCQHGSNDTPIDYPTYGHLGKKISFDKLPEVCQKVVINDYKDVWNLK